jgi:hypothetical protein
MIQLAVINESTAISDADVKKMIPAFETQWNRDLAPAWDLGQAKVEWFDKTEAPTAGSWWVVFLDDSDQADALAYHDVTDQGLPISKVFARTLTQDNASISVGATHEICEMAVDPTINLAAQDKKGTFWAYEVCDPVEDDRYGYEINGVLVTDFVTPAWFGFQNSQGPLDFKQHATKPFAVLSGGYAQKFGKHGWQQINGAEAEASEKMHISRPSSGTRRMRRVRNTVEDRKCEVSANAATRNDIRRTLQR